jgi:hypothetical protein
MSKSSVVVAPAVDADVSAKTIDVVSVDASRTDLAYWTEILKSLGLGMNRGTTQNLTPEEIEIEELEEYVRTARIENAKPSNAGRPRKRKKRSITPVMRWTTGPIGGFNILGAKPHAWGRNRINGQTSGRKDGGPHGVLVYIGDSEDLAGLERQQARDESGRVTPTGHGPTTD